MPSRDFGEGRVMVAARDGDEDEQDKGGFEIHRGFANVGMFSRAAQRSAKDNSHAPTHERTI